MTPEELLVNISNQVAGLTQKVTDLYENLYGRGENGDMTMLRKRYHEHANFIESHEIGIARIKEDLAKCQAVERAAMSQVQDGMVDMRMSRAKFWGIIVGISVGAAGLGSGLADLLVKVVKGG